MTVSIHEPDQTLPRSPLREFVANLIAADLPWIIMVWAITTAFIFLWWVDGLLGVI
jgi:hypothetical protein